MIKADSNTLEWFIDRYKANKENFKIVEKRGNKYLYEDAELKVAYFKGKLFNNNNEFGTSMGVVKSLKSDFDNFIKKSNGIIPIQPENNNTIISNYINLSKVKKFFFELDIERAYLQTMYILGYITKKNYDKYRTLEEFKSPSIYSITWLQAPEKVFEYENGIKVKEYTKEVDPNYKLMYDNIRYFINNITDEAIKYAIKDEFLIKKCIDALYIRPEAFNSLYNFYLEQDIHFKINLLERKEGIENEYYKMGKLHSFS